MKTTRLAGSVKQISGVALLLLTAGAFAVPTTSGNVMEVPGDGWYGCNALITMKAFAKASCAAR